MKIAEIKEILARRFENVIFRVVNEEEEISQLLTDSRNHYNADGALFFALHPQGGNDGHNFVKNLYDKGIRNFILNYIPENFRKIQDANIILVPDTLEALGEVSKIRRKNAKEIVAITGSRGKTTLKEIIYQLLEPYYRISRSPRSFNSKIGVPLSLWKITPGSDFAFIEAGISKEGEMKNLADLIVPDTVIFTNIGEAHSGGFKSLEDKVKEKCRLAEPPNVKTIIYPIDSPYFDSILKRFSEGKRLIGWSQTDRNADVFIHRVENGFFYIWKGKKRFIPVTLEKEYDIENIVGALIFMLKEGIKPDIIENRITNLQTIKTRLNVSEGVNGCSIIQDSYTSDLTSLLPAIDIIKRRKMPSQSLTLIVSDLHHEGSDCRQTYQDIAKIIKDTGISKFIGIGKVIKKHSSIFPQEFNIYESVEEFLKTFKASDFNDEIILLKGSGEYGFERIFEQLAAKKHETVLEVNLDAMLRNYNYFRSKIPSSCGIIAMVKASGYGAGSYEIAKTLQDAGASYLAVAALDEGVELRNNGIVMPVMVMNPRAANYRALFNNRLEPVIYSYEMLQILKEESVRYGFKEYPVHIKLDTGMHRMGFEEKDLSKLIGLIKDTPQIRVASIFSHLATADCIDMDEFTYGQLDKFEKMSSLIIQELGYDIKRHILNSAGILRFPDYHYEMVRLGIGLYGANTLPPEYEKPLATVSTLRTVIIAIREISGNEAVGYGRKGKIEGLTRIATIPIGYADGMNRKFGNGNIRVLLNGHTVPTIGSICMDATMLNVTGIDCKVGDEVEVFGENMSLQRLADTLDTIPYEILTSISPRVKRVYFRE